MLDGVPGPLTVSVGVVTALVASVLVYRDADRHGHYHALSASAAVGIAALVGFAVGNLVGLVVATGYVLLLYLLSYPSTPGVDGTAKRRTVDRPDGTPQGDPGENLSGDDVVSVIRVEIASEETLRELADRYDDVPADAAVPKLRSLLRVKAFDSVIDGADGDDSPPLSDWASEFEEEGVGDWHGESADEERPSAGAAAWNAAPSGDEEERDERETDEAGADAWSTESIDDDAPPVDATGNMQEWATVSDGGEAVDGDGETRTEADTDASEFGWAEVEAEE